METNEVDQVMERLTELAHRIAKDMPEDKRQAMHEKLLTKELDNFIKKVDYINKLMGGMSESIKIGVVVDKLFYGVYVESKEFQSEAEAHDYAQLRAEQVKSE